MTVNKRDKIEIAMDSNKVVKNYGAKMGEHGLLGEGTIGDPKEVGDKLSSAFDVAANWCGGMLESRHYSDTPRPGFLSWGCTGRAGRQEALRHCAAAAELPVTWGLGNPNLWTKRNMIGNCGYSQVPNRSHGRCVLEEEDANLSLRVFQQSYFQIQCLTEEED